MFKRVLRWLAASGVVVVTTITVDAALGLGSLPVWDGEVAEKYHSYPPPLIGAMVLVLTGIAVREYYNRRDKDS